MRWVEPSETSLHLYVVEDSAAEYALLSHVLLAHDPSLVLRRAPSLSEIDEFEVARADAILLDLCLPDSFGLDTVFRMRDIAANVPLIVLTSENTDDNALGAIELGADDFVVKGSVDASTFIRSIRVAIRRRKIIDELESAWRRARATACRDELTGLLNRRAFLESLAFAASSPAADNHALVFVDLDGFKSVNDLLGHQAGDALLVAVAQRLRAHCRKQDLVARLGGDEFVALLVGADAEAALHVAERLRAELRFSLDCGQAIVSASIGVALASTDELSPTDLIAAADRAMYRAKRNGGDEVELSDDGQAWDVDGAKAASDLQIGD